MQSISDVIARLPRDDRGRIQSRLEPGLPDPPDQIEASSIVVDCMSWVEWQDLVEYYLSVPDLGPRDVEQRLRSDLRRAYAEQGGDPGVEILGVADLRDRAIESFRVQTD